MVKSSAWIREQCEQAGLISPFLTEPVRKGVISFGPGPYGYDLRLDQGFRRIARSRELIDPLNAVEGAYLEFRGESLILEPGDCVLGRSLEYLRIPRGVIGLAFGKSTYARAGILVNVTPLEPEWEGFLTISIANTAPCPVRIHAGQGILQLIFIEGDGLPLFSYKDLGGKYNGQHDITIPRID